MCRPGLEDWEIWWSSMNTNLGFACSMIYAPWVETSTFATSSRRRQGNSCRGISTISCTCSNRAISSDESGRDLGEDFALIEGCLVCDLMVLIEPKDIWNILLPVFTQTAPAARSPSHLCVCVCVSFFFLGCEGDLQALPKTWRPESDLLYCI